MEVEEFPNQNNKMTIPIEQFRKLWQGKPIEDLDAEHTRLLGTLKFEAHFLKGLKHLQRRFSVTERELADGEARCEALDAQCRVLMECLKAAESRQRTKAYLTT
jgi:hypothetical protein